MPDSGDLGESGLDEGNSRCRGADVCDEYDDRPYLFITIALSTLLAMGRTVIVRLEGPRRSHQVQTRAGPSKVPLFVVSWSL